MKSLIAITLLLSATANANYNLAENGKAVKCYADDNQSWVLNKSRTSLKYTVEGESLGAKRILHVKTDGRTYISYSTSEGTLTLGKKDSFRFADDGQAGQVDCE